MLAKRQNSFKLATLFSFDGGWTTKTFFFINVSSASEATFSFSTRFVDVDPRLGDGHWPLVVLWDDEFFSKNLNSDPKTMKKILIISLNAPWTL
jgi:hypothetical protein